MELQFFKPDQKQTPFVLLDTHKCEACWECINSCNNNVIGKVDIFIQKHAVIKNPGKCTGCLKCIRVCTFGAYSKISNNYRKNSSSI
jgi:2-oxoglutarate ferredoxin oxidoreductase subunit delta